MGKGTGRGRHASQQGNSGRQDAERVNVAAGVNVELVDLRLLGASATPARVTPVSVPLNESLAALDPSPPTAHQARSCNGTCARQADLEMVALLDEIYLRWGNVEDAGILEKTPGLLKDEEVDQAYAEAFREFGVDIATLGTSQAAQAILARSIREESLAAKKARG